MTFMISCTNILSRVGSLVATRVRLVVFKRGLTTYIPLQWMGKSLNDFWLKLYLSGWLPTWATWRRPWWRHRTEERWEIDRILSENAVLRPLHPIKQPLLKGNIDCLTFVMFQFLFTSESVGEGHPGESFFFDQCFFFSFFNWTNIHIDQSESSLTIGNWVLSLRVSRDLKQLNWCFLSLLISVQSVFRLVAD